jgi:hypothetical protein
MPLINSLVELIIAWFETKRMKCAEAINNSNINMQKAASSVEEEFPTRRIGFSLSEEEEECEEDEDL